jgi:hypothetical protein
MTPLHLVDMTPFMFTPSAFGLVLPVKVCAASLPPKLLFTYNLLFLPAFQLTPRSNNCLILPSEGLRTCIVGWTLIWLIFWLPGFDDVCWYFYISFSILTIFSGFLFLLGGLFLFFRTLHSFISSSHLTHNLTFSVFHSSLILMMILIYSSGELPSR